MVAGAALVGKWQIVESGTWPRNHLDLCGPAFLRIDADGTGEIAFGALCASVDGGFTPSGVDFDWNGADEGGDPHQHVSYSRSTSRHNLYAF